MAMKKKSASSKAKAKASAKAFGKAIGGPTVKKRVAKKKKMSK